MISYSSAAVDFQLHRVRGGGTPAHSTRLVRCDNQQGALQWGHCCSTNVRSYSNNNSSLGLLHRYASDIHVMTRFLSNPFIIRVPFCLIFSFDKGTLNQKGQKGTTQEPRWGLSEQVKDRPSTRASSLDAHSCVDFLCSCFRHKKCSWCLGIIRKLVDNMNGKMRTVLINLFC